jgi:hypothetical protein
MAPTTAILERALRDPASVFATPEAVAEHGGLTREQKIEILRSWQYEVAEAEVATEEGMPGGNGELMTRIVAALDSIIGGIQAGDSAPTKQHGLVARRPRE